MLFWMLGNLITVNKIEETVNISYANNANVESRFRWISVIA